MLEPLAATLDTIELIYAAALAPAGWDDALQAVAKLCGARAAGIRVDRTTWTI